jgi:hypothetical protein
MAEFRELALQREGRRASRAALLVIVAIWIALAAIACWYAWSKATR